MEVEYLPLLGAPLLGHDELPEGVILRGGLARVCHAELAEGVLHLVGVGPVLDALGLAALDLEK